LSVVGCSVLIVDGGRDQEPIPQQPAAAGVSGACSDGIVEAAVRARAAREAADADTLAGDPYLTEVLARLHEAITDLSQTRWSARGPAVLAAGLRALAREQARLDSAALRLVGDVDGRDDVVLRAKPRTAGAAFLRTALGLERHRASRDADLARLVTGEQTDLAAMGAAYAAGDITRSHVEVAASVHRRLGAAARERLMPVTDPDSVPDTGEVTGETQRRTIEVVDAALAARARDFTVPEFARIGDRIVEALNPPSADGAHQRRYLHLSRLADGSVHGKFFCGPVQALKLTAVLAALAAPRPGRAVDADGIDHDLPDERTAPQRRMDALIDAIDHHDCHRHLTDVVGTERTDSGGTENGGTGNGGTGNGGTQNSCAENSRVQQRISTANGTETAPETADDHLAQSPSGDLAQSQPGDFAQSPSSPGGFAQCDEPPPEGDFQVRRPAGVRTGPYPDVEIIVTASLDQLAHARGIARGETGGSPAGAPAVANEEFAHAQHAGSIHPSVLGVLACSGRLRRVVLDEHGGVLHVGRSHRLATPAQKAALLGRDVGCVIPGCTVPADLCEIHHVIPWADGGPTDIDNLVFVCPRHHVEVTDGTWQLYMINGVPWARPPAWAHPTRPLLRNASHRPPSVAA
jgi:hypothetical protein